MSVWTFACTASGVSDTFESLNIQDARRSLNSCASDRFSFIHVPDDGVSAIALCAFDDVVSITKDSTVWFKGYCRSIPRSGNMPSERISYDIVGPWFDLERITWQQRWKIWDTATAQLTWQYKSRVILGQDESGDALTVGEVIKEILTYAIDVKGALLQLPSGEYSTWGWPTMQMPLEEATNITCDNAILRLLAFCPDYKIRIDYSGDPNPVFQLVKRSSASAVSFALGTANVIDHAITPRNDLAIPGIVIKFERVDTVDGVSYPHLEEKSAGVTDDLDTLIVTLQLAGANINTQSVDVEVEEPPATWTDKDWWKRYVPSLTAIADADLTLNACIQEVEEDDEGNPLYNFADIPNILKEGTVAPWISGAKAARVTLKLNYDYVERDELDGVAGDRRNQELDLQLTFTNLDTRTYSRSEGDLAEEAPAGFATALYASWSSLQYDGSIVTADDEVPGTVLPGDVVNITAGLTAWASMRAHVQQIQESIDNGVTSIVFGPNKRIDPDTLLALMRRFRTRISASSHVVRTSGLSSDGAGVNTGGPGPVNQVDTAGGATTRQRYTPEYDPEAPPTYTKEIDLDPDEIVPNNEATAGSIVIKPRLLELVEAAPAGSENPYQVVRRQVIASDGEGDAAPFNEEEDPEFYEECDQNTHPQDQDTGPGGGNPDEDDGTEHPQDEDGDGGGVAGGGYPGGDPGSDEGTEHPSNADCYSTIPDSIP